MATATDDKAAPIPSLALGEDQAALAEAVAAFARHAGGASAARAGLAGFASGTLPENWPRLLAQGLHAIHLPERCGGDGAGMAELAVVVEQLARGLHPGPFTPTAIAGATLTQAAQSEAVDALLARFTEGATGAVCTGAGLTAQRADGGWTVTGTSDPALGIPGADVVLVRAEADGSPVWFRLPEGPGATITQRIGVDATRAIGTLTLQELHVPGEDVLDDIRDGDAEWVRAVVFAAEAAGIAGWSLETATAHVRTREQFGRPIGSFQAVQHKAAMMLVRSSIACAAAWDAARAESGDDVQRAIAAAQAVVAALEAAVDNAFECVSLLGAVGFTWEHDVHLYQRRALSIAALAGSPERWSARLGELALAGGARDFSFVTSETLPELRTQIGATLDQAAQMPPDEVEGYGWGTGRGGARRAVLAEAGLVAPHYPAPHGLGAGPVEQAVIAQEYAAHGLDQPTMVIGEWVLPTLLSHGSDAQRERFVGPTLRGEIVWCQLFSEPGAGSDLAGLSTAARRVDGGWVINGQKVWNTNAHEADWGVCLARTDPSAPKHQGISYFLIDMHAEGVDARPLRQATGRAEFNEVFLDEVFVPDECLVAGPGEGWRLAATTLANERLQMGAALGHGAGDRFQRLIEAGEYDCPREDAVRTMGRGVSRELALQALNLRGVLARLAGAGPGAEISVSKLYNALAQRDGSRDLIRLLGPGAAAHDAEPGVTDDHVTDHLGLPAVLFGGGTIEIQLGVIARRVLRLPR
ncbi:acyl-CoA dehydrogenase [Tomitella cavernea]|uniref:Acyl-CoA dehydrogenase n=1 Tax=Tomitella cavernea TaxID=1387982 RepID=A0ABP9C1C3_9ACTN|nr:acyl-CoA dehydrogenase [Tomitella cavernea]